MEMQHNVGFAWPAFKFIVAVDKVAMGDMGNVVLGFDFFFTITLAGTVVVTAIVSTLPISVITWPPIYIPYMYVCIEMQPILM